VSTRQMHILGRAGSSPDLNTVNGDTQIATVGVATEEYHDDETVWVNVVAFGQSAEFLANYCTKGDFVFAQGRPQIDKWTGDDGETRVKLELVADDISVPKLRDSGDGGGKRAGGGGGGVPSGEGDDYSDDSFDNSDIPFAHDAAIEQSWDTMT